MQACQGKEKGGMRKDPAFETGGLEQGQQEPPSMSWKELKEQRKKLLADRWQLLEEKERELELDRKWQEVYANKLHAIADKLSKQMEQCDSSLPTPASRGLEEGQQAGQGVAWKKARRVAWNKASKKPRLARRMPRLVAWNKARRKRRRKSLGRKLLRREKGRSRRSAAIVAWNKARRKSLHRKARVCF